MLTEDQAKLIVVGAASVAAAVWLAAVVLAWCWRKPRKIGPVGQTLTGRTPAELRDALGRAAALMQPAWELVGGEARGDERYAVFETPTGMKATCEVRVEVDDAPQGSTVTCFTRPGVNAPWVWWVIALFLLAIPVATVMMSTWIWGRIELAPNDAARQVTLNMMQLIHILWPPFLILGLWRANSNIKREQLRRFMTSLELIVPPMDNADTSYAVSPTEPTP